MRSFAVALVVFCFGLVIAGAAAAGPTRPASNQIPPPGQFLLQTQAPSTALPVLSDVRAAEAGSQAPPPGQVYVESLPATPPPFAADPYTQGPGLGQQSRIFRLSQPASRSLPSKRFGPNGAMSALNVTGINHWWTYEEDAIGGVGRYMVNVATGNLIVQADDMAIPHKGISLAFRRTYNSYSQHDYSNTDGSVVDNYGNGWTSTFDAHIAQNTLNDPHCGRSGISVYDIDGARYDYAMTYQNSTCFYTPPTGQFNTLTYDSTSGLYYWTKTSGTVYMFHNPTDSNVGVAGRLSKIWARNNNDKLTFTYSFDSGATPAPSTLHTITVQTESTAGVSLTATLNFGSFSGTNQSTHRLLATLIWPDGTVITYKYDTNGRLVEVDEPSDTTSTSSIPQLYTYASGGHLLASVNGGRWSNSGGTDGQIISFDYSGASAVDARYNGWINPTVPQPSAAPTPIQYPIAGNYGTQTNLPYRFVTFAASTTGVTPSPAPQPAPSMSPCAGTTPWYDSDGHETLYCWDSSNRVVQTDDWTGSMWLVTTQTWDSNNDLTATKDARGNETDYAYDAIGDTTMVAQPQVNSFRPTATYAYDINYNVVSYCDPVWNNNHGDDYSGGTVPTCPATWTNTQTNPGPSQFSYQTQTYEPFGELITITKPMGYNTAIRYPAPLVDYGLPTQSVGDSITEDDGSIVVPTQLFTYDSLGNIICYSQSITGPVPSPAPSSSPSLATWALAYDHDGTNQTLGRVVQIADPDDGSSISVNKCAKPSNSTTTSTYKYYYANGEVEETETAAQHVIDQAPPSPGVPFPQGGVSYQYDPDGNETLEVHNHGFAQGQTQKWYDAAERLVQVQQPYESRSLGLPSPAPGNPCNNTGHANDCYPFAWVTRYLYDLTHGGSSLTIGNITGVRAYGDLFKTQEYLTSGWTDLKGNAYDAMDRATAKYADAPGHTGLQTWPSVYDGTSGTYGLLTSSTDPLSEIATFTYDPLGRDSSVTYSGTVTPNLAYAYDPDGRKQSITSTLAGTNETQQYQFDADGRMTTSTEPSNIKSPATLTYGYYPNGWRESLSVSSSALTQSSPPMYRYSYRADGRQAWEQVNHGQAYIFTRGYAPSGRLVSQSDPQGWNTLAYDATGQEASFVLNAPGITTTLNSYAYDAEGSLTGKTIVGGGVSFSNVYNVRGEVISSTWPAAGGGPWLSYRHSANGYLYPVNQAVCGAGCGPEVDYVTLDALSGVALSDEVQCYLSQGCPQPETWTYDAAGRQTVESVPVSVSQKYTFQFPLDKSYDAENRTISQNSNNPYYPLTCYGVFGQDSLNVADVRSYSWGPNGHLQEINSTTTPQWNNQTQTADRTLHWDGDQLLFTTSTSGSTTTLDDLKVDISADFTPQDPNFTGLTMWDRDLDGVGLYMHNANGQHVVISQGPFSQQHCINRGTTGFPASFGWVFNANGNAANAGLIVQPRADGIYDGINTFQGVRVYDDNAGVWTSPDAYAGAVDDPMSQKSYMWNKNDPVSYSDPSGFWPSFPCVASLTSCPKGPPLRTSHAVAHRAGSMWLGIMMMFGMGAGPEEDTAMLARSLSGEEFQKLTENYGSNLANKINHIFGNADHNLQGLVQSFGGNTAKAMGALQTATEAALKAAGQTSGTFAEQVTINGNVITVKGAIINGVVKIGTAYVPR